TAFLVPAIAISIKLTGHALPQVGMGATLANEGVPLLDKLDQIHADLGFASYTEPFVGRWDKINVFCTALALMVGTAGWGLFIPTPWGAIDLSDSVTGTFIPADPIPPGTVVTRGEQRKGRIGMPPPEFFIPGTYDVFVFDARDPAAFMKDISALCGQAVLPPKWVMGYQQSHRTLRTEAQILEVIDTFRKKNIPLDSVCYLGTGFCPRGWNKSQPSFEFNPDLFKRDPKEVLAEMHKHNVKVMMHMIPWDRDRLATIQGTIPAKPGEKLDNTHIQNYWNEHNALMDAGVDAWWPDEGDWFDFHERMKRHELYYTGPLSKQPNVRPWS
ncbi:MAG: hypothetical protein GY876_07385, partial [Planctomycetes bacterium]|nr:hypothetical protein [Planctomycetota bacterium]